GGGEGLGAGVFPAAPRFNLLGLFGDPLEVDHCARSSKGCGGHPAAPRSADAPPASDIGREIIIMDVLEFAARRGEAGLCGDRMTEIPQGPPENLETREEHLRLSVAEV